ESIVPLAAVSDGMGLNITVLSFGGGLHAGIVADPAQVPDVERIAGWIAEELAALAVAARCGGPGGTDQRVRANGRGGGQPARASRTNERVEDEQL
ncbi:MAG TPA: WS/DGAT domain-containing protein, partial [Micromonosporaceae bacterium]|nr:WS/DGAT domain-containing protein [Micromonosporaceae bacterium]